MIAYYLVKGMIAADCFGGLDIEPREDGVYYVVLFDSITDIWAGEVVDVEFELIADVLKEHGYIGPDEKLEEFASVS